MFLLARPRGRGFSGAVEMAGSVLCGRSLLACDLEAVGCVKWVGIAAATADRVIGIPRAGLVVCRLLAYK